MSVFRREQGRGHRAVGLGDDVDAVAAGGAVAAQQAGTID